MAHLQALTLPKADPADIPTGGIAEIILPNLRSSGIYLPSLAFLSRENHDRWLTWLVTTKADKTELQLHGFDLAKSRFVYTKNQDQCFKLLCDALFNGNSHTVVANPGRLTEAQLIKLEVAARSGRCHGLLLRDRDNAPFGS